MAKLPATARGARTSKAVWACSAARCNRTQVAGKGRRGRESPRSSVSKENPLLCNSNSAHRKPAAQAGGRTHNTRGNKVPARAKEKGCSASTKSIHATNSPRRVAAATVCNANEVRPVERAPYTSLRRPRGHPPSRRASSAGNAVGTRAGGSLAPPRRKPGSVRGDEPREELPLGAASPPGRVEAKGALSCGKREGSRTEIDCTEEVRMAPDFRLIFAKRQHPLDCL